MQPCDIIADLLSPLQVLAQRSAALRTMKHSSCLYVFSEASQSFSFVDRIAMVFRQPPHSLVQFVLETVF